MTPRKPPPDESAGSLAVVDDDLSTFFAVPFDPTPPAEATFHLVVREGPDAEMSLVVDGAAPGRLLLGTSPSCALRLTDRSVSRRHLALEVEGARLRVTDLGSKNGTRVGSLVVREALLAGGEEIRAGATVIAVTSTRTRGAELGVETRFGAMLGASREMRRLFPLLRKLAPSDLPVLIEGETGTGKETAALALHAESPRAGQPFVVLDCAAISEAAFESEVFGEEGPSGITPGVFEQAQGGTLFLDEIGELAASCQPKLLRILEHGVLRRMGGARPIQVDARVVASTRLDLDEAVARGRFRDDLFHRLAVTRVELPALRTRRGDLPLLVAHFCRELGGDPSHLPSALVASWQPMPWPGNLRELKNAVSKRLVLGELTQLESSMGSGPTRGHTGGWLEGVLEQKLPLTEARAIVVEDFEHRYVEHMLRASDGNVARAAAASGVARRYFQILKARVR